MWNSFVDKGKALAEKAAAAAADIDKQLDDVVGIPDASLATAVGATSSTAATASTDANETLDDPWADDFNVESPGKSAGDASLAEEPTEKTPSMPVDMHHEDAQLPTPTLSVEAEQEHQPTVNEQQDESNGDDSGWDEDELAFEAVDTKTEEVTEPLVAVETIPEEMPRKEAPQEEAATLDTNEPITESPGEVNGVVGMEPAVMANQVDTSAIPVENDGDWAEEDGLDFDNDPDASGQVPPNQGAQTLSIDKLSDGDPPAIQQPETVPPTLSLDQPSVETMEQTVRSVNEPPAITIEESPFQDPSVGPHSPASDQLSIDQSDQSPVIDSPMPLNESVAEMSPAVESSEPVEEPQPQAEQQEAVEQSVQEAEPIDVTTNAVDMMANVPPKEETSPESLVQFQAHHETTRKLEQDLQALQRQLVQREDQLVSKTEQMSTMESMFETEKEQLQAKIHNTKEEAKKRIQKARDRVENMEARIKTLTAAKSSEVGDAAQQAELIAALRAEGENLARKQSEMEKAVRSAKGEARELGEQLEEEMMAKENALEKIALLESDLKSTRDNLAAARRGESQAGKLDVELQQAREDSERKSVTILSLEQQVKEFRAEAKDLNVELQASRKGAVVDNERDQKKWRREHNDAIKDLENKLRIGEREAGVREDALRHEVAELRKRWQDAVRRADSLSMDSQSSTAPLLRQLESIHRQNRARASAWAELETKLRSELEENVIANEKLSRERGDWKTKFSRLERTAKEHEDSLKVTKSSLDEKTIRVKQVEAKLSDMEVEGSKMKEEWAEVERLANEGVSRVRSEMTMTVVESEERHRSQLDALEGELRQEREKRSQLEQQVDQLVKNAGIIVPQEAMHQPLEPPSKPKKLLKSANQADILAGALSGLGDDEDSVDDDELSEVENEPMSNGVGSFAALEELTGRLKAAKVELITLRKSLIDSEASRKELAEELGEARNAKEKLPLFEAKVTELTEETRQQSLEIQALQEDIVEVKEMYRTQLNLLLEEKVAVVEEPVSTNGESDDPLEDASLPVDDDNVTVEVNASDSN